MSFINLKTLVRSINLNEFAKDVTSHEAKLEQVNIAQIKELIKVIFTKYSLPELILIWFKYANLK